MAIKKGKILLRDASSMKDFEDMKSIVLCALSNNKYQYYRYYWYYDEYDEYDDYYNEIDKCSVCGECSCCCKCGDYDYYYKEDIFGNSIITCIPAGKEYLRKKKIDSLLNVEINEPINTIHSQLLKLGLVAQ